MGERVLCLGFSVVDVVVLGAPPLREAFARSDTELVTGISHHAGGDALNQAVTMSGLGLEPILHVVTGDDFVAEVLTDCVSRHGIISRIIRVPGGATPTSVPVVDRNGGRHFYYTPGCQPNLRLADFDLGLLNEVSLLSAASFLANPLLDREVLPAFLQAAKARGIPTIADCNADIFGLGPEIVLRQLPWVDYFLPSLQEAQFLSGVDQPEEMVRVLKGRGAKNVIVKLGEQGCYLDCHDFVGFVPAVEVSPVVDTTGAGDAFSATFSYGLLQGWPSRRIAQTAVVVAAASVRVAGANAYMQDRDQVHRFLAEHNCENVMS